MTATPYGELIARLREATGPDRWLDGLIFRAIGAPLPKEFLTHKIALEWSDEEGCFVMPIDTLRVRYEQPNYTASIDAALTLVPDGFAADVTQFSGRHLGKARVWCGPPDAAEFLCDRAPTPALALCIAALLARQSP